MKRRLLIIATAMLVPLVGCIEHLKDVEQEGQLEPTVRAPHPLPDRNLETSVIGVRREGDQVLAEIDVGTRDGVKEGWRGRSPSVAPSSPASGSSRLASTARWAS